MDKVSSGLIALSSAIVVAVYAAGYDRTKAAADRFAAQASARATAPHAQPVAPVVAPVAAPVIAPIGPAPLVVEPRKHAPRPRARKAAPSLPSVAATAPTTLPAVSAQAPGDVPAPVAPSAPSAPSAPTYRDGTYLGWGTSRHGDIQAQVVIQNGRIASAMIAQCLTRYPCSVIEKLPPQVAARQSPEVDYVSGATQSADAFYYAVVQALSKAK